MPITFNCPRCAAAYTVNDDAAGKSTTCKKCHAAMTIPAVTPPPVAGPGLFAPPAPEPTGPVESGGGPSLSDVLALGRTLALCVIAVALMILAFRGGSTRVFQK